MSKVIALVEEGVVVNTIMAESWPDGIDITDMVPRPGVGWLYDGEVFTPPGSTTPSEVRRITRLAFRQRLTQAERIAMDLAGETPVYRDDEHSEETRAQFQARRANAAAFRDLNQQVTEATYIDLDRADTRAGVQLLETVGILGSGRALEILDNPILDGERPL